jgi:uncharacterized short protein YbdD (DUF466 family)
MAILRRCWRLILEATGDAAYARYRERLREREPGRRPLDRRAFYLEHLNRKYARPSRCC